MYFLYYETETSAFGNDIYVNHERETKCSSLLPITIDRMAPVINLLKRLRIELLFSCYLEPDFYEICSIWTYVIVVICHFTVLSAK